ncbi:secretin and TonB N-terminal domain-containing protein, partial [bacterium]|nr:secretin and TonB N-terminal domain-containing protein [bacterium]
LYRRAIEAFRQVVDLEGDYDILYTPHADSYIEKSKEKLREQIRSDKLKEIKDIESEMITKVIEAARISTEPFLGTMTRDIFPPTPVSIADIHRKMDIPVNMDFQDVDVVYVLDYLSETTGANVVMSSAVTKGKRTVSVKIKDMPLEDALKYVLKSASLTYRIDKNVIWIATPEEINNEQMETRVFTLKKGKGTYTEFSSPTTGGVGLGSAGNIEEVITIKDIIEEALTWPSGSKIVLDERLAALIVTNTPYNLEIIEKILEKIDIEPIQVLIEARFLEITVTDLNELGIDWQLGSELPFDKTKVGMVHGIASGSGTSFTDTTRQTEGFNLTYQGVLTKPQFQVMLHALEETQKVKTLSAPRITTLDNQMATIKVVDEWIYPTRYEFQIVQFDLNGDGDFNDANETLYKNVPTDFVKRDVGILLRVVPSVGMEDDVITLTLIPEVSDGTAGYFSYSGDVSLPLFTSRNLTTSVVVNNGDTVVLGGLIKETESTVETKIPILGDLPWVGPFFRKDTSSITRKNLLIFVTASIISKSGEEVVLRRVAQ